MADFLEDYSNVNAAASAVTGFLKGMEGAEDRKYKQLEQEARMKSMETEKENKAFQRALDMRKSGLQKNPDGSFSRNQEHDRAEFAARGMTPNYNEAGEFTGASYTQEYKDMQREKAFADPYGARALQAEKARQDVAEGAKKNTPGGKVEKLSGDQRKRFDEATGALDALRDVKAAFSNIKIDTIGGRSEMVDVPLRGDTKYTEASNRFKEYIGRLQTGAAITKDEAAAFKRLIPTAFDTPDIAKQKMEELEFKLGATIKGFGVSTDEAQELGFLKPRKGLISTGLIGAAPAAPVQSAALKPGTRDGDYDYVGGDPADPKSWKKAR